MFPIFGYCGLGPFDRDEFFGYVQVRRYNLAGLDLVGVSLFPGFLVGRMCLVM